MTAAAELVAANPYPGLRAFAANESDRFFGRRQQIDELAVRVEVSSFLAVAGSSGCGKSSLVRAGLLRELSRRSEEGGPVDWRYTILRPGNRPIANLAEHLFPVLAPDRSADTSRVSALYGRLTLGGLALAEEIKLACPDPRTRILVVVDQFEEIFRFQRMTSADEAGAFVKLLLEAAADPESKVSVIITLRSDALGTCADFRDLPEAINRGLYLVPKLTREQRRHAIAKPAELRGHRLAPRLVQRVLNDVSDSFDDLPIMQHVLSRTWNRWAEACAGRRDIDLEDYEHESVGTARYALSNHADEAFRSLTGLAAVTEKVFRALTERVADGAETSDVRRPLEFRRLCDVVGAGPDQVSIVIERYRRPDTAFLMPSQDTPLTDNPVIDISHESLMRQWGQLRAWMALEAESRTTLLRLVDAASAHEAGTVGVWRGRELARALAWRTKTGPTPAWIELYVPGDGKTTSVLTNSFLQSGRRARAGRMLAIGAVGVLLLVLAWIAGSRELRWRHETKLRELVSRAMETLTPQPAHSAHFALAAVDQDRNNARAAYLLRQTLTNLEMAHTVRILLHGEMVRDTRYSYDGSRLITASGSRVRIFDSTTLDLVQTVDRKGTVLAAWLLGGGRILLTHADDGSGRNQLQMEKLGESNVHDLACAGERDYVFRAEVSPDQSLVAAGCWNGLVRVWDVNNPAGAPQDFPRTTPAGVTVTAVAFAASGDYLASGDAGGVVNVWKMNEGNPWIRKNTNASESPIRHATGTAIQSVAFHPTDDSLLATAGDDRQSVVWRLDLERRRLPPHSTQEPAIWRLLHDRSVTQATFAPREGDPNPLFTVSDKVVRFWTNATADPKQVRPHDDWIASAAASADGEILATASNDGTARIWSTRSGAPIAVLLGHRDYLTDAAIRPDGNQVTTASADGMVRVWQVRLPRLLLATDRWALGAAFAHDGSRIVVGQEGRVSILTPRDEAVRATAAVEVLTPGDPSDAVSYLSWSGDRTLVVGYRTHYGLSGRAGPVMWSVLTKEDVTPDWLRTYTRAAFRPGTNELVLLDDKGQIAVWEANAKSLREARPPEPMTMTRTGVYLSAEMSPDGTWIAAVNGIDNTIHLWNRRRPSDPPRVLKGHTGGLRSVQFSRDSRWLVSSSVDRTARIWSVDALEPLQTLRGHTSTLFSAAFDPSGTRVVTGGADTTIRVWDASTAAELATLRWHGEAINEVQFSPDGKWILSASDDGTVKLGECGTCGLTLDELRARVGALAVLTDDERNEIRREIEITTGYFMWPRLLPPRD